VGAPGVVAGVTELDGDDGTLVPIELVAVTVNVYAVPFVRPVTVIGDETPDASMPPGGDDITLYLVIVAPPFDAGAVKETVACPLPLVAVPIVGAPGADVGVTVLDAEDSALVPPAFVADTLK
jgi:hypothetical protein